MYGRKWQIVTVLVAIGYSFSKLHKKLFEFATGHAGIGDLLGTLRSTNALSGAASVAAGPQGLFLFTFAVIICWWWKCGSQFERTLGLVFKAAELERSYLQHLKDEIPNRMHFVVGLLLSISPVTFYFGSTPLHTFVVTNAIVLASLWVKDWHYFVYTTRLTCVLSIIDVAMNGLPWTKAMGVFYVVLGMNCCLHFSTTFVAIAMEIAAFFAYTAANAPAGAEAEIKHKEMASILVTSHVCALVIIYIGFRFRRKAFGDAQQNQSLKRQLELKEEALEVLGTGVLITDAARRVVYVNHAWCIETGYQKNEVIGQHAEAPFLVGPDTDLAVLGDIQRAIDEGRHFRGEVLSYKKDGRAFWNDYTCAPVHLRVPGGGGIPVGTPRAVQFVETIHDVTQKVLMRQNEMNAYLAHAQNQQQQQHEF